MNIRILLGVILAVWLAACGDKDTKKTKVDTTVETGIPASICPMEPLAGQTKSAFRPLDHDGGPSDLYLEWEVYRQEGYICSGDYSFKLRASNISQHTDAKRMWFTVIFYYGNEYIENYSISPQGTTIPVGQTHEFDFSFRVNEAFASSTNRDITIAIIIQSDNPNFSDPDAFFTRTWLRFVPASDCDPTPMPQPEPHNISIHSVTCQDATVLLQTHESLMSGYPRAEVISGPLSLNGGVYQDGRFYYQSVHVDGRIPDDVEARVDLVNNEDDRLRFYFKERVDCAWLPQTPPSTPGPETPPVTPEPSEPPPFEPGEGEERTIREQFASITACGLIIDDAIIPPSAAPVTGTVWKEVNAGGETHLILDVARLPEPSVGKSGAGEGWVHSVKAGDYIAWLVRREDHRIRFLPIAEIEADRNGRAKTKVGIQPSKVAGLGGGQGIWLDAEGVSHDAGEAMPLSAYDGIVITLQPKGEHAKPNGILFGGGSRNR